MAYDPQAKRPRPKPRDTDAAPVEALLPNKAPDESPANNTPPLMDDRPPSPAVTPERADPPSDALLVNTGLTAAIGVFLALVVLRYLWRRRGKSPQTPDC